jgi:hypothetical protein
MSYIKLGALLFSMFAVTAFVGASESDELREKAEAVQREAAELAEQGHNDEAANLKRKAMDMLEKAERLEHDRLDQRHPQIMKLNRFLERLRQEEKNLEEVGPAAGVEEGLAAIRRAAEEVETKLRALSQGPPREHRAPEEDIARRLEHMRIAVEHLNQAGLQDIAEHVAQRAEATERELHERHRQQGGDVMHEVMKQLDEMRHEIGRLRDEVNELREKR